MERIIQLLISSFGPLMKARTNDGTADVDFICAWHDSCFLTICLCNEISKNKLLSKTASSMSG